MTWVELLSMSNKPGVLSSKAWLTVFYGVFLLQVECNPEIKAYLGSGALCLFLVIKSLEDADARRNPPSMPPSLVEDQNDGLLKSNM